ncbi:MAG: glycosyltransferase, partial [Eggerthellaceae bacterium]|nr:glycosyltransferase [Eggerthellaceae bacterium]
MSNASPEVSIIVPVYNNYYYLNKCLDSLVSQTLSSIEIICIDDGSDDGSGALIDEWAGKDSRIKAVHEKNSGVAHARNVGLDIAQGRYILFVDSDDYIAYRSCEFLCEVADATEADIVVFGGMTFPGFGELDWGFSHADEVVVNDWIRALFYVGGSLPLMCNKFYSRRLLNDRFKGD